MAWVARHFTKGGETVLAEDVLHEANLLWDGWRPVEPLPVDAHETPVSLADLDALEAEILAFL